MKLKTQYCKNEMNMSHYRRQITNAFDKNNYERVN